MSRPSLETLAVDRAPLESLMPVAALEAIVQRFGRPPLVVRNDKVVLEPLTDFPADTSAKIKGVERWMPSVGRIEFVNHSMSWGGTGWVADRRDGGWVIVTNRHVAEIVARRKADGTGVFVRSPSGGRYGAAIDFFEEVDSPDDDSRTAQITAIDYLADDAAADVALLWVKVADFAMPTPFELIDGPVGKGDLVALIGYPAYDSRNNADDQARYFRDLYEVKRFAPGKVMQPPSDGMLLNHDCTSLGGNSGSPLISLEDGKVVGLHFSGEYGKANAAVSAATLKQLLRGERPVDVILSSTETEAPSDGHHTAEEFEGREGFNIHFLKDGAIKAPWPGLRRDLQEALAEPRDGPREPNELRYTHFGVKYSARSAAFAAQPGEDTVAGAGEPHSRQRAHARLPGLRLHRPGAA